MLRLQFTRVAAGPPGGDLLTASAVAAEAAEAAEAPAAALVRVEIVRDFKDAWIELVRLLHEAAEIEHALLVQYLFAAFSVRPKYARLRGDNFEFDAGNLMGVAIQEMTHLHQVNRFLVAVGAAPNLVRQDFPYEAAIYPFEFNLEPLSRETVAKYVYTEAPANAVDPDDPGAEHPFVDDLIRTLGGLRPNHLGSLYGKVIEVTGEIVAKQQAAGGSPDGEFGFLPDLREWPDTLLSIKQQGEADHFDFFKSVFKAEHAAFGGNTNVWNDPDGPDYPSVRLPTNRSAYLGSENQIEDEDTRQVAWLGNLHYWIMLVLLDLFYATLNLAADEPDTPPRNRRHYFERAKEHMMGPLWDLGLHLAALPRPAGLPFDPLSMGYYPGRSRRFTLLMLRNLILEAQALTADLTARGLLPDSTSLTQTLQETLEALRTNGDL
ncbi:MAG TPA: ferritin-like domain-containing protein [Pyrinomonadaceae bacterium]|jgi:hypothetical protein|nr:ferritin-like domain-containing protein [Pyrinomonadaceae bacterium]